MRESHCLLVLEVYWWKIYERSMTSLKSVNTDTCGERCRGASHKKASSFELKHDWHCFPKVYFLSKLRMQRCELVVSSGLDMESEEFWMEILSLHPCIEILDNILIQTQNRFQSKRKLDFSLLMNINMYERCNRDFPVNCLKTLGMQCVQFCLYQSFEKLSVCSLLFVWVLR